MARYQVPRNDGRDEPVEEYLEWWEAEVDSRVARAVGGLPVTRDVYELAERAGWVGRYGLVHGG